MTDVFGIETKELAAAFVLVGVGTVVCQMILLKPAVARLGERGVLIGACVCIVISKTGYFLIGLFRPHWKWFVYLQYTIFSPLVLLVFPAVSAMKANVCPPSKQGQVRSRFVRRARAREIERANCEDRAFGTHVVRSVFRFKVPSSEYARSRKPSVRPFLR